MSKNHQKNDCEKVVKMIPRGSKMEPKSIKKSININIKINVEKNRKKYQKIMKNHDVETIKIELSYHSGAIFKKIVKIRNDTKKY